MRMLGARGLLLLALASLADATGLRRTPLVRSVASLDRHNVRARLKSSLRVSAAQAGQQALFYATMLRAQSSFAGKPPGRTEEPQESIQRLMKG